MKIFYLMYVMFLLIVGCIAYSTVDWLKESLQHTRTDVILREATR